MRKLRKFFVVFGLAAFAVGCLRVQRLPDGSPNYGGVTSSRDVIELQNSAVIMRAVREANRNGQPVSAMFDGQGGGSVQVGQYGYGIYPGEYWNNDQHFAASAARSAQVWAEQVAAEQPIPVPASRFERRELFDPEVLRQTEQPKSFRRVESGRQAVCCGNLEPRVETLEVVAKQVIKRAVARKKEAAAAKATPAGITPTRK